MKKVQFTVKINAAANRVYDIMLGLTDKSTYEAWTALFNPSSTYEGSWTKGTKMLFVGVDDDGVKGGMVSEIFDIIPNRFVSIRHYGLYKANEEITEGPEVEKWANGFENYTFDFNDGTTLVTVDIDVTEEFLDYFEEAYPKALNKLKEISESALDARA